MGAVSSEGSVEQLQDLVVFTVVRKILVQQLLRCVQVVHLLTVQSNRIARALHFGAEHAHRQFGRLCGLIGVAVASGKECGRASGTFALQLSGPWDGIRFTGIVEIQVQEFGKHVVIRKGPGLMTFEELPCAFQVVGGVAVEGDPATGFFHVAARLTNLKGLGGGSGRRTARNHGGCATRLLALHCRDGIRRISTGRSLCARVTIMGLKQLLERVELCVQLTAAVGSQVGSGAEVSAGEHEKQGVGSGFHCEIWWGVEHYFCERWMRLRSIST